MASELCEDCWRFQKFKEDCHFHWEGKLECSKWMEHDADDERYKTIIDSSFLF